MIRRQRGEVYCYLLERDSAGWKVTQAYGASDWERFFAPGIQLVPVDVTP